MKSSTVPVRPIVLAGALSVVDFVYRSASGEPMTWYSAGLSVLSGALLGMLLVWLTAQLVASKQALLGVLGFALFVVEFVVNMVEGYFFSTVFPSIGSLLAALPIVAAVALLQAALAVVLLPSKPVGMRLQFALREYVVSRGRAGWIVRWAVAAVAYLPVYLAFGAIVGPIVLPYYTDSQTGLVLPNGQTIVLVELFRGALYVLALFPVLALLRWSRRVAFLAVAGLVYIPGSLLPLVTRTWLPAQVIVLQSLELLGDALVYAFVLTRLLAPRNLGAGTSGKQPTPLRSV